MPVEWKDLSEVERHSLKQISLAPYLRLLPEMAMRLKELGLVEQKFGGTSLTKVGREMLADVAADRLRHRTPGRRR
jgi:Mn-dependent DtxR family transcriptional regulator